MDSGNRSSSTCGPGGVTGELPSLLKNVATEWMCKKYYYEEATARVMSGQAERGEESEMH